MSKEKNAGDIELYDKDLLNQIDKEKEIKKEINKLMRFGEDIGYGSMGNISKYYFLHDCLNEKDRKEYEMELKEKDSQKFHEYKIWEKFFEYIIKKKLNDENCKINVVNMDNMENENKEEPKLNYEDFYKLTGRKLTGKISHSSSYEIDAKLNEIIDELEEELNE